jgi:hypothetical protein
MTPAPCNRLATLAYWAKEPVCPIRVDCASPATVLPLWNSWALAAGATATARLRTAKAARNMDFIGSLHLLSGDMSGFDGL